LSNSRCLLKLTKNYTGRNNYMPIQFSEIIIDKI